MKDLAEYCSMFSNTFGDAKVFVGGECVVRYAYNLANVKDKRSVVYPVTDLFLRDKKCVNQVRDQLGLYNYHYKMESGYWVTDRPEQPSKVLLHLANEYPNVQDFLASRDFTIEAIAYCAGQFFYHEEWAYHALIRKLYINQHRTVSNPRKVLRRVMYYLSEGFTLDPSTADILIDSLKVEPSDDEVVKKINIDLEEALNSLSNAIDRGAK